jgi:hypothetical protein
MIAPTWLQYSSDTGELIAVRAMRAGGNNDSSGRAS